MESLNLLGDTQVPELLEPRDVGEAPVGMEQHLQVEVHISLLLDGRDERISVDAYWWHDLCNCFIIKYYKN